MDPIRVRSNDIMKPTHCLSQSFHISHIFYIFSHAFHCDRFQPWQSWQLHLAKATEKGCGNMWNVKTLGSLGMKISRVFCFFSRQLCISHYFSTPRTLQGFSKAKALHVVQFGPLPPGPKACAWTSISNPLKVSVDGQRKRIQKNQQDAKSSLWVRLDSWSAFFDDLRCILYRLHTSKKTTWVLGHISNLSARTSTTWGDLACVTSSTWLLHIRGYTWHKHDLNPFQTLEDASFQMYCNITYLRKYLYTRISQNYIWVQHAMWYCKYTPTNACRTEGIWRNQTANGSNNVTNNVSLLINIFWPWSYLDYITTSC